MTAKAPIKIIKRDERTRQNQKEEPNRSPSEAAREMVATVSDWVNEFQQKRRSETSQALKTLFGDTPQPNQA